MPYLLDTAQQQLLLNPGSIRPSTTCHSLPIAGAPTQRPPLCRGRVSFLRSQNFAYILLTDYLRSIAYVDTR